MKKESTIQKEVISHLSTIQGIFFFSIPNEGFMQSAIMSGMDKKMVAIMSRHLKKLGLVPGVPDICILYRKYWSDEIKLSKTLFIELKKPGEKPNKTQLLIHEKIKSVGHDVEVAYSLDGVKKLLVGYGIVKGDF